MTAILAAFWPYIAGAFVALVGALVAALKVIGRQRRDLGKAKAAEKSTKDMNNVDTMRDADDAARIERLRRFERDNRP
jgi:hypothetical protein